MTTTKNQRTPIKDTRLGIVVQIHGHCIKTTTIMDMIQAILTHRDKFRLIVGGARRLGIPFHTAWPQHIRLTMTHTVDSAFQLFISINRILLHEISVTLDRCKGMISSVFCIFGFRHQAAQHSLLKCLALVQVFFKIPLSGLKHFSYYICYTHNKLRNLPAKLRNSIVKGEYFSIFYHLRCNLNPNCRDGAKGCSL